MSSSKKLFQQLRLRLEATCQGDELDATVFLVLESMGISKTDVLVDREKVVTPEALEEITGRLVLGEPVQYVLGYAWFFGERFKVDPSVLIPRPETELLIDLVTKAFPGNEPVSVIDFGTGSGVIAITIARLRPRWKVIATDLSTDALKVASYNASSQGVQVDFLQHDMLTGISPGRFKVMVSNPPYIPPREKALLSDRVRRHEPHIALFAKDPEGLGFYRALAEMAFHSLEPDGLLVVEIHEQASESVTGVFRSAGLGHISVHRDQFGKERFVLAIKCGLP